LVKRTLFASPSILIITLTGLAFLLGTVVLFNAMPKPIRLHQPVQLEFGVSDPQFRHTLQALFGNPVVEGNRIELLKNGEDIYQGMLESIARAEHTVTLETFEFWGEKSAGAVADALAKASERGVRVHVTLDYIGSALADESKFQRMEDAGVMLNRWRAPSWYELSRFNHRTHRKLLVVDGREAFTGGANISDNWLGDIADGAYRDNHFRIQGPAVAHLQAAFQENWLDAMGEMLLGQAYLPQLETQGETPLQVVNSAPREGHYQMRMLFLIAFAAAEERIRIASAYFYPDNMVLEALKDAAERGVEVEILVPGGEINQGFFRHASVNRWQGMLEAGVRLYEYEPSMLHVKLLIVDDQWTSIGSSNMDNRSFRINDETNVNVFDTDFARKMGATLDADMAQAKRYTKERWEQRPWHKRLAGWVTMTVGAHL